MHEADIARRAGDSRFVPVLLRQYVLHELVVVDPRTLLPGLRPFFGLALCLIQHVPGLLGWIGTRSSFLLRWNRLLQYLQTIEATGRELSSLQPSLLPRLTVLACERLQSLVRRPLQAFNGFIELPSSIRCLGLGYC